MGQWKVRSKRQEAINPTQRYGLKSYRIVDWKMFADARALIL